MNPLNCNRQIFESLLNAANTLSDEALARVKAFVQKQKHYHGGFMDRAGKSDLYYTVFGYTLSLVLDIKPDVKREKEYLQSIDNKKLDFVHLICFLRSEFLLKLIKLQQLANFDLRKDLKNGFIENLTIKQISRSIRNEHKAIFDELELYRSVDGGFNHNEKNARHSTIYANFLVWTLFTDLGFKKEELKQICDSCKSHQLHNGAFANENGSMDGVSAATAAGLIMMNSTKNADLSNQWLKSNITSKGGIKAAQGAPIADLLSTATAYLALQLSGENLEPFAENSLNFINLHWDESGGFFGSIADMVCDVEYTYYALLGIGVLS